MFKHKAQGFILGIITTILCTTFILLGSCNNIINDEVNSANNNVDQNTENNYIESVDNSKLEVEVVFDDLYMFFNSINLPKALLVAELKNTGTAPVRFTNMSIELEDPDGKILSVKDYVSIYPDVIDVGETAYICESVLSVSSSAEDLEAIGGYLVHYDLKKTNKPESLNVEITETNLSLKTNRLNIVGRIENKSDKELKNIYIACPIFDEDNKLLTVIFTIVDSLKPGEKKGFEQMDLDGDNSNVKYSTAVTYKVIPYLRKLF